MGALDDNSPDTANSASVEIIGFNSLQVNVKIRWAPTVTIDLKLKVVILHHRKRLQVVVRYARWEWNAGFLGLPTWPVDVAAMVTDMAESGLDSLKVELADNLRDELENTLSAGGSIMDAASVTFAFMDKDGTVAGLLKL